MNHINRRTFLHYAGLLGLGLLANAKLDLAKTENAIAVQLDWLYSVQFAGLLLADSDRLFQQQGIQVELRPWHEGIVVTDEVAADPSVIGCAEQHLILTAQAQGKPIRAIAAMFQQSPLGLMAMPATGMRSLQDLAGKTVGMHAHNLEVIDLVAAYSQMNRTDIQVVEIPYEGKRDRLLDGEVDAVQCYTIDEPIELARETGITPDVLSFSNYGYEAYVQVLFAHQDLLASRPLAVKQFVQATFDGWRRVLADIPAAARLVVDTYAEPGSGYEDLDYQTHSLQAIAQLVSVGVGRDRLGYIDPERWQAMAERMAQFGIIPKAPARSQSLDLTCWT